MALSVEHRFDMNQLSKDLAIDGRDTFLFVKNKESNKMKVWIIMKDHDRNPYQCSLPEIKLETHLLYQDSSPVHKDIFKRYGGELTLSRDNQGTEFYFRINGPSIFQGENTGYRLYVTGTSMDKRIHFHQSPMDEVVHVISNLIAEKKFIPNTQHTSKTIPLGPRRKRKANEVYNDHLDSQVVDSLSLDNARCESEDLYNADFFKHLDDDILFKNFSIDDNIDAVEREFVKKYADDDTVDQEEDKEEEVMVSMRVDQLIDAYCVSGECLCCKKLIERNLFFKESLHNVECDFARSVLPILQSSFGVENSYLEVQKSNEDLANPDQHGLISGGCNTFAKVQLTPELVFGHQEDTTRDYDDVERSILKFLI
jgi:hypothetical protein